MDRLLRSLAVPAAALLLLSPAPALARKHIVAPGDPGSSQYQEDVPTAGGGQPVSTIGGRAAQTAPVVAPAVARQIKRHGSAGRGAVALSQTTAPPPSVRNRTRRLRYHSVAAAALLARAVVGSGGGIGNLLPIMLGLSLVVAIMLTMWRRRG